MQINNIIRRHICLYTFVKMIKYKKRKLIIRYTTEWDQTSTKIKINVDKRAGVNMN